MHISEKVYTFAKEIKKHNIMKEFETLTKLKNKILYERKTILRRGKEDALSSEEVLSDTRSSRFGSEQENREAH